MTQVNHSESDMMAAEKVGIFAIKADEQRAELVNPGETPFTGETLPVNRRLRPRLGFLRLRVFSAMLGTRP